MRVHIVAGCIACGACESICPEVFTVHDTAEVNPDAVAGLENDVREAADVCPVSVIQIAE
jgi:ferredoxin